MHATIIIFGATGDLAKKKLIPALYSLVKRGLLTNYVVIGGAADSVKVSEILESSRPFIDGFEPESWQGFSEHFYYKPISFEQTEAFTEFVSYVTDLERSYELSGSRLFYLAAPADYFCILTKNIATSGLGCRQDKPDQWCRIVYEKPFGKDLESAHAINECIAHYFNEQQIYRIDHFLTKELASNITLLRFANAVFEPLWDHRHIKNVQIILDEQEGITGRGRYYDQYGALRDVVQNHMLQLLALVGMEPPEKIMGDYIRNERAKVLQNVRFIDGICGQYSGYRDEVGVDKNSTTETWASLVCEIDTPRWAGIPFYLRTGKCLKKKETVIHIEFKTVDCLLVKGCPIPTNYLTIRIDPDAGFTLHLNAKKPGPTTELMPVAMDFCHSCLYATATPKPYEVLLEEILQGAQSIVVRFDEIEQSWRIVDAMRKAVRTCYTYECGSAGPVEAEKFDQKHGIRWLS